MEEVPEVKDVLRHYGFENPLLMDYANHSHDPDMWSHSFKIGNQAYLLVEVEFLGDDLEEEEYARLQEDLAIPKENLRLAPPKLGQMQTMHNQAGVGIDGHRVVKNPDDDTKYRNPHGLDTETTWVLFKLI